MSKILVVGDPHEDACHPAYRAWMRHLYNKWKCNKTVIIGDIVDHHNISFHDRDPDCPGPSEEFKRTKKKVRLWHQDFPKAWICIGNHDERVVRLAKSVNITTPFLGNYNLVWKTPTWKWVNDVKIDDVYYFHGTGCSGIHPAYNAMKAMLMSTVMGHCHSASGIKWACNPDKRIFAMDTGCGIDVKAPQFNYGRKYKKRPVLSAGVILDGYPLHFVMPCGCGERWHRSRFTRKRGS